MLDVLTSDYQFGYSYKTGSIESLVAHELGHNVHVALALKRSKIEYGKPLNLIQQQIFKNEYAKIKQEIYSVSFTHESLEDIYIKCSNELGRMTEGKPGELIAQSFGNYYYGEEKSAIASKIVKFFMKELR